MRSALLQHSSYIDRPSLRSRVTAFLLALVVTILIVLMLIQLGILPPIVRQPDHPPVTFQMAPPTSQVASSSERTTTKTKQANHAAARPNPIKAVTPPPPAPPSPPKLLALSSTDFAATDIGSMHSDASADSASGDSASASTYGPGEGPGGAKLYNAEWYVEPTRAQMAYYVPPGGLQPGWGEIACKTVAKYHVDDCRELGESPGSGIARTMRRAAWQFLVVPPRLNGHVQIGAWVRIHYDILPVSSNGAGAP